MTDQKQKMTKAQRATLLVAVITNFINPFSTSSLNVAVPHIGTEFHIGAANLTWIVLSFILTTVILAIPIGRIADIRGRESILKAGILLIGLASLGNIFAPNIVLFFVLRVVQGAGGAMIFATSTSILVDAFPLNRRGRVLGIAIAAVYTGGSCGPVIGGVLTHHYGWRSVFLFIAVWAAVAFTIAMIRLPKKEKVLNPQVLSKVSIVLYMIAIGLVTYGLTTLMQNHWSYLILGVGIVVTVIFVRHELHTDMPVVDIRLLRSNTVFTFANLASLFNYASTFSIAYLMSIYLQFVKGLDADMAGLILIFNPIVQTVISPISGRLSDKRPPHFLASFGMAFCASALLMLAFVNEKTSFPYIIGALILVGIGLGVFSSPNSNMIMSSVGKNDYSMAASFNSTVRNMGQVICMVIITIIMNAVIGNKAIVNASKSEIVFDVHISFAVFACICFVGVFFSLKHRPSDSVQL